VFEFCTDPALVVEVNPATLTVLDVAPFNLISMICSALQPETVNISKRISWEQTSPSGTVLTLSHNGLDTYINDVSYNSSTSTSMLSLYATSEGRWMYTCQASIQVPGDPMVTYSQVAEVTVKGRYVMQRAGLLIISIPRHVSSLEAD
jgi:hypothetical protein